MNLPLFIAGKIYRHGGGKAGRPAISIATAGVAVGLAVMLVSVSIVTGFKHAIRDKVVGLGGHITVASAMALHGRDARPVCIDDSMMAALGSLPGVSHVQRYAVKQGILKTGNDFMGVAFKGVAAEYDTAFIHGSMADGSIPRFSDKASGNKILISKVMSDRLRLGTGDKVFAYFIDDNGVRTRRFTVSGVYSTNLARFDESVCFTDLYTVARLNRWQPGQVSGAEVAVADFGNLGKVADEFVARVNRTTDRYGETYSAQTVEDANPQIFSWLDLLDINVWVILALMLSVAGFTVVSGLLIVILERTSMIGLLKALGARGKLVSETFVWFAMFVVGRGMVVGNIVGLGLAALQMSTGIVKLDPATYYVSSVPVEFSLPAIILVNLATLLVSLLVLIVPSILVSRVHPARSMRYE